MASECGLGLAIVVLDTSHYSRAFRDLITHDHTYIQLDELSVNISICTSKLSAKLGSCLLQF